MGVALAAATFVAVPGCTNALEDTDSSESELITSLDPTQRPQDRMKLVDILTKRHPLPKGVADRFSGITIQTRWQMESGRWQAGVRPGTKEMEAWWARVNFHLTVVPFLVLKQHRGEFPDVNVSVPNDPSYALYDDAAKTTLAYFDAVDAAYKKSLQKPLSADEADAISDDLQRKVWSFHMVALREGMRRNEHLLPSLPEGERRFAQSWATVVGLFSAMNVPTTPINESFNELALPPRVVRTDDYNLKRASDLSTVERATVIGLDTLARFESRWGHPLEKIFHKLSLDPTVSERIGEIVVVALKNGESVARAILKAVREIGADDTPAQGLTGDEQP